MMTSPNLVHTTAKLAYRISELATLIGVSADFIRLRIKSGELKAHKVGWIVLILKENADAWLHSHPIGPGDGDDLDSEESREV